MRTKVISVTAIAVALVLAGCSSPSAPSPTDAQEDCTTKILLATNVTGGGSANGTANVNGMDAAMETINDEGGVLGCTLEYDVVDDTSDYTKSLPLVQAAIGTTDYAAVVAGDFGSTSIAPYLNRQGMFGFIINSALGIAVPDVNPNLFNVSSPVASHAGPLMDYIADEGNKSVALLVDTTATGASAAAAYTAAAIAAGMTVTATETVELSAVNMTPAVQRPQASGADAVVFNVFGAAAGYFVRDYRASGWDAPLFGGSSVQQTNLATLVPESDLKDIVIAGFAVNTTPSSDAAQTLVDQIKAQGKEITTALALSATAHDTAILFAWAANGAGSLDPQAITDYLSENGDVDVPNLTLAPQTNYSAGNHEWHAKNAVALSVAGPFDDGRLAALKQ